MAERFKVRVKELRERRLLSVAEKMLAKGGCEKFTVSALAAAAGVAKGTIYTHYKSEEELLKAVLARVSSELVSGLDRDGKPGAREKLELSLATVVASVTGRSHGHLGFPCCLKRSPCPFAGTCELEAALRKIIQRARAEGMVPADTDPGLAATLFLSSAVTVAARHHDLSKAEEEFSAMCRLFLRGLAA